MAIIAAPEHRVTAVAAVLSEGIIVVVFGLRTFVSRCRGRSGPAAAGVR